MKPSNIGLSILLLVVVSVVCLLLGELAARVVLDPVDYLNPELVEHDALRHAIVPGSGGHDKWGFRNREVPENVEVAILGDSQTYGCSAPARQSWPAHFEEISGRETYNLGVGGYGPADYLYLYRTRVQELDPEIVLVGLYFGNDFKDAFRSVYTVAYWSDFRDPAIDGKALLGKDVTDVVALNERPITQSGILYDIRIWLGGHSVLYRVAGMSILGAIVHGAEHRSLNEGTLIVKVGPDSATQLLSAGRVTSMDSSLSVVKEGLDLTIEMISAMDSLAADEDREFAVVLIPTKHLVLEPEVRAQKSDDIEEGFLIIPASERFLKAAVVTSFAARNIRYVDSLPYLREAFDNGDLPYSEVGGHPNGAGYERIARAALEQLGY
ncbi:MAG: hypothetical protein MAG453_02006 [Calditrichaeota bacterium]|nr:hypothetical protein [Calditrichota bacterium]